MQDFAALRCMSFGAMLRFVFIVYDVCGPTIQELCSLVWYRFAQMIKSATTRPISY